HAHRHASPHRDFASYLPRVTLSDCHGPDLSPQEDPALATRCKKRHLHRLRRGNVSRARHRPVGTVDEAPRAERCCAPRRRRGLAQRKSLAEFLVIRPDFREFQRLAKQGNLIPVYDIFPADLLTPVSAYLRIAQGARYSFLLESVEGNEKIARYSFAGANPEEIFRYVSGACVMESPDRLVWEERDPVSFLRECIERFHPVRVPGLPPLVAGAIGYFSYDMVRLIERLPKRLRDEIGLYDAMLAFYHGLIAFDHVQHRLWIVRNVYTGGPGSTLRARYSAAVREIRRTRKLLEQPVADERPRKESRKKDAKLRVRSNFRRPEYLAAVRKAKQYIRAGDIFQAVLSQRLDRKSKAQPFEIYRELRALNPSPYLFFLQMNDVAVVGSSPEMLVRVRGRDVF